MRSLWLNLTATFLAILALSIVSKGQTVLISVSDPEGDDKGPGYYGYPANPVFKPGVFDIVKFQVIDNGASLVFAITFKDLGGNPWGGPNGFSLQNIQIYVRTTQGLPTRSDTLGLNAVFSPNFAWHFAIMVVPGWEEKVVPEGQRSGIYYYNYNIVQDGNLTVKVDGNTIMAIVDKKALIDVENIASWTIVVALASYDGFGPNRVRPVGVTGGEWVLNGTRYATPEQAARVAKAIAAGIEPRILDLLVYSPDLKTGITADTQYMWLDSYNPDLGLMATISPIKIPIEIPIPTVTITAIETKILSYTYTYTTPIPTTVVETRINWPISIGLLVVGLVIGAIIVRFLIK